MKQSKPGRRWIEWHRPTDMNIWHAANRIEQVANEIMSKKGAI